MKKHLIWRVGLYVLGMLILVLGALLNNRTGLGVFAINSLPFAIAEAFDISFAVITFIFYCIFIALQFLLRGKAHRRWSDLLQLPFALTFSALLEIFDRVIVFQPHNPAESVLLLLASIAVTAIGIPLTISMEIIPNPADGLLETLSWKLGKEMGLTKNIEDGICLAGAFLVDLIFGTMWTSIGLGTVVSMILLGRLVSFYNRLCRKKMRALAGLDGEEA